MTDLQMLGNSFCEFGSWYRRTKDLVPLFDPKVHLFENSSLKIMAQLIWNTSIYKVWEISGKTFISFSCLKIVKYVEDKLCFIGFERFHLKYFCLSFKFFVI